MFSMFDPRTLSIINIPLSFVYSFLILLVKIQFPRQFKGTGFWCLSLLLPIFTFTLYYINNQSLSVLLFNLMALSYFLSNISLLLGWILFFDNKPPYLSVLLLLFSGLGIPLLLSAKAIPPHILHELFNLIIFSSILIFLIKKHRKKHIYSSTLVLALYIIAVIVTLTPILNSVIAGHRFDPIKNMRILSITYMIRNSLVLFSIYLAVMHQFKVNHNMSMDEKDRLMRELEVLSVTDVLTGLYNRRGFDNYISYEFKQSKRNNEEYVITLGDIDFFKKVNDTYGHDCGDEVIKRVSDAIENNIREQDCLARWGGEEFIIMQKVNSPAIAIKVIERIKNEIENMKILYKNSTVSITMSFGMARMSGESHNYDQVIIEADKNLYKAKQSGRNCIIF